jgi:hypothetical protein
MHTKNTRYTKVTNLVRGDPDQSSCSGLIIHFAFASNNIDLEPLNEQVGEEEQKNSIAKESCCHCG